MAFTVYAYKDEAGTPVYVGGTFQRPRARDSQHRRTIADTPLAKQLRGGRLVMEVLQVRDEWSRRNPRDLLAAEYTERYWVNRLETSREDGGLNAVKAGGGFHGYKKAPDPRDYTIRARYENGEHSTTLSKEYGMTASAILVAVERAGGKSRGRSGAQKGVPKMWCRSLPPEAEPDVVRRYIAGETLVGIASSLGVSQKPVRNILERNGVALRKRGYFMKRNRKASS